MAFIRIVEPQEAGEDLRAVYQEMAARPMPDVYRAPHGGPPGIIRAHSLDPELIRVTLSACGAYQMPQALTWAEQELIAAAASQSNGCFY